MVTAVPDCDACVVAAESAATRGGTVECVCGAVHGAPTHRPTTPPRRVVTGPQRAREGRVWRVAEGDAPAAAAAPLARQGAAAQARHDRDCDGVLDRGAAAAAVGAAATTLASHGYNVLVVSLADEEMRRIRLEELRDAS